MSGPNETEALARIQKSFGIKTKFSKRFYPDIFEKKLLNKASHGDVYNIAQDRGSASIGHMLSGEVRYGQVWVRDGQSSKIQLFSDYTKTQKYSSYKYIKLGSKK